MLRAFLKKNMKLPELFEEKMRRLLGEDFSEYEKHLDDPAYYGIRVNTLKISVEDFLKICPFYVTKVPWTDNGFYVDREEKPSKHPYYHAGLYYIQEPSAMTPASYLPVEPGDRVLDLCGAPGGKSTELGAKLRGEGLLVSNDVSISRTTVSNAVHGLSPWISHLTCRPGCTPFTPSKSGQRLPPTYYRGCWHVVSRGLF